jgi:hypothetical protein
MELENETDYLRREVPGYRLAQMLNRTIPKGEVVFTWGAAPEGYLDGIMRVDYHSTHNQRLAEILLALSTPRHRAYIVQCWSLAQQRRWELEWAVTVTQKTRLSEVWLTDMGRRITPSEGTASVNPWEAGDFLDGSAVIAWSPRLPGSRRVRLGLRLSQLEWVDGICALASEIDASEAGRPMRDYAWTPDEELRRSALEALRRDGVDWLLLFDGQLRDEDFLRMERQG